MEKATHTAAAEDVYISVDLSFRNSQIYFERVTIFVIPVTQVIQCDPGAGD